MFVFSEVDSYCYRTAKVGQTVKFTCHTKLDNDVDWEYVDKLKSNEKYIYRGKVGIDIQWRDRRFKVMNKSHSHTLVIQNVTINDSAYYRCVEDSGFGNGHFHALAVQGDFLFLYIILLVSRNYFTLYTVVQKTGCILYCTTSFNVCRIAV